MRTPLLYLCGLATLISATEQPPNYVCGRADIAPVIDGRGDDAVWQQARELSPLRDIEGAAIPHECRIKMAWDDAFLYIFADMQEQHLWATLTEHDSVIYRDPDFEVFIDPDGDGLNYIELEINALNTTWDLFLTRPYRFNSPYILHDWEIPGLRHAVHLRGTLNDASDTDEGWSVELAIPWSSITGHGNQPRSGTAPEAGSSMRFNFSRVNWQVRPDTASPCGYAKLTDESGNPLPESNHVWAPTGKINIHLPEHWGRVVFSHRSAAEWESAPPEPQERTRLALYRVLNAQLETRAKEGRFSRSFPLPSGVQMAFPTEDFFILSATCPHCGIRMTLDSEGRYTQSAPHRQMPKIFLWVQEDSTGSEPWESTCQRYAEAGINTLIISGTAEQIATLTPAAAKAGMEVYAWLWALNRPMDSEPPRHPDWFAVNAQGKSCHREKDRPFVSYYQFLCPNHEKVQQHLLREVRRLAAVPGLSGIQADYIRMPDITLPRHLWDYYGLDMSEPSPAHDYCYCTTCREKFRAQYGRLPRPAPAEDREWREFRLSAIADFYNMLAEETRRHHLRSACSVFPTPSMSAEMVRQDWGRFRTDLALPMVYHSFYDEDNAWAVDTTRRAAQETGGRIPLAPGLHLPDIPANQLAARLDDFLAIGCHGIALYSNAELTDEHLQALRQWVEEQRRSLSPESADSHTAPNSYQAPPQQVKGGDNQHTFHHIGIRRTAKRNEPQYHHHGIE